MNGILDLRTWDFKKDGNVPLNGEWEFYPNEFLPVAPLWETDRFRENKNFIKVPSKWESFQKQNQLEKIHYCSYRLKVIMPDEGIYLSVDLPSIGAAYSFYSNGLKIAGAGSPGKSKNEYVPAYKPDVYELLFEQEYVEIIVHAASFHYQNGSGLWEPMVLGLGTEINSKARARSIIDAIALGTLSIMAVYHLSIYLMRRNELSALYFSILCICVSVRVLIYGEKIILNFPFFVEHYFLSVRLEILFMYLLLPVFIKYLESIFPSVYSKDYFLNSLFFAGVFYSFIGAFTPVEIYTKDIFIKSFQAVFFIMIIYIFIKIPLIIREKQEGSRIFMFGIAVNLFTITNDILFVNKIINTFFMGAFGFLAFIFAQSILLSARFSKGFIESEKLGNKLKELNLDLENQVRQRTLELEKEKAEIENLNSMIKKLNESADPDTVLSDILSQIEFSFGIEGCWLWLLDEKKKELYPYKHSIIAKDLYSKEEVEWLTSLRISENSNSILSVLLKKPKTFFLQNARKYSEKMSEIDKELIQKLRFEQMLVVPLLIEGKTTGFLFFADVRTNAGIDKKIFPSLENYASQIASVIRNASLLKAANSAKEELRILNDFTNLINSYSDLKQIFKSISEFIMKKYSIGSVWLLLPDEKNEFLLTYKAFSYDKIPAEKFQRILDFRVPLNESGGLLFRIWQRSEPYYFRRTADNDNFFDNEILSFGLRSGLVVPLILNRKPVGILCFSNINSQLKLSKPEIERINSFCSQITGVINTVHLLKITERQKERTEKLNQLIKELNTESELKNIIEKLIRHINEKYSLPQYAFYIVNEKKSHIRMKDASFPDFLTDEDADIIRGLEIPIENVKGVHAFTFKSKRPFFLRKVRKSNAMTAEEDLILRKTEIHSILLIPLLLNNELIGIIDLMNSFQNVHLEKDDIIYLSIVGEQLAGILHRTNLLKEVQDEKEKALVAQFEAVTAKLKVENINQFLKSIQSKENIKEVLNEIHKYTEFSFGIVYQSLWLYNPENETLNFYYGSYPDEDAKLNFLKDGARTLHLGGIGAHTLACKKKRSFFIPNTSKHRSGDEAELKNQILLSMNSLLIVPLIVQDKLIGTLDFSHGKNKLSLKTSEIEQISIFSGQVAGIIHNFSLLEKINQERNKSENLLLNILPKDVATELKEKGFSEPVLFEEVSVMFTDFKGFTQIAEILSPQELIKELDACFVQFDKITERYNLEKLKTIGDSYMCAGGIPRKNNTHSVDCVLAALEIQSFMNLMKSLKKEKGFPYWELRLGIHTGPLVAGVIGEKKFAYDVWGDTVNTASRMESSGTPGRINISGTTYKKIENYFECEYRGKVNAKNKGEVEMYYVTRLKKEYSKDEDGRVPNGKFWNQYGN